MSRSPWDLGEVLERDDADEVRMVGFPFGPGGVLPYGVTESSVVGLPAVLRALDIIATGVSQLPWTEFLNNLELPPSRLVRRPSADYTRREWVQRVTNTLALERVCYLLKVGGYDVEGVPVGLWPLPPQIVTAEYTDQYSFMPPLRYWIGQQLRSADDLVILRLGPIPGIPDYLASTLKIARAMLGGAIAAENYASRFWQGGGSPTTVLETEANLSEPQAEQLGNRWAQRRAKGPDHPAILSHGLKGKEWGANITTQSAVEARMQITADVGRLFGIGPRLMNAPANNAQTYATAQEENLDLLHYTLENYIGSIEDAITDVLPGGREMKMRTSQLTEGTELARAQAYQLATGNLPWITPEEVREGEGLPPKEMPEPVQPAPTTTMVAGPTQSGRQP